MDQLSRILGLPHQEKIERGLVYTPAEIAQQPETWLETFQLFSNRKAEIQRFLEESGIFAPSTSRPTVFLVGAGTSDYVGQAVSYLLRSAWQCEVIPVPSTDLLTHMDGWVLPGRKYLWISFSRSGDTPEGFAALERAYRTYPDIRHIVVSCNSNSRMIRESAANRNALPVTLPDAANDRGLAMTSSFSNMAVFGQCLAHANDLNTYEPILRKLVAVGRAFLPRAADSAAALAAEAYKKLCFVGSGPLLAVARECALKSLELTAGKTLTMSQSTLGLRHGPMAALDGESLFVSFLSSDPQVQKYERDLLQEIGEKKLARRRVVVGGSEAARDSFAENYLAPGISDGVPDEYRAPVDVIFGQCLGLFLSIHWKLKPDAPSPSGVINRVVQNVHIYQ